MHRSHSLGAALLAVTLVPSAPAYQEGSELRNAVQKAREAQKEVCVDPKVPATTRRRLWAQRGFVQDGHRHGAMSTVERYEIAEALKTDQVTGLLVRSLPRKRLAVRDIEALLALGPPEEVEAGLRAALEKATAREARERARKVVEGKNPAPGLNLPEGLGVAWREPGDYTQVAWFEEARVVLALKKGGECDVFDREGQRVGAFMASPELGDAYRMTPAILADDVGDPVPGLVVARRNGRLVGLDLTGLPLWTTKLEVMSSELHAGDLDDDGLDEVVLSGRNRRTLCAVGAAGEHLWVRESGPANYGFAIGNFHERPGDEIALSSFRRIELLKRGAQAIEVWSVKETMNRPSTESTPGELDALLCITRDQRLLRVSGNTDQDDALVTTVDLKTLAPKDGLLQAAGQTQDVGISGDVTMTAGSGVAFTRNAARIVLEDAVLPVDESLITSRSSFAVIPWGPDESAPILVVASSIWKGALTAIPLERATER